MHLPGRRGAEARPSQVHAVTKLEPAVFALTTAIAFTSRRGCECVSSNDESRRCPESGSSTLEFLYGHLTAACDPSDA